jgi:hypothetical protein
LGKLFRLNEGRKGAQTALGKQMKLVAYEQFKRKDVHAAHLLNSPSKEPGIEEHRCNQEIDHTDADANLRPAEP